jgi:single-strand DNA-binding protein
MNKVILMGRLTRDPEVRYSQGANPVAVARYTLAVDRRFKREGEPSADFIPCVAFGKGGEFVEKFFKKGQLVSVVGRIQVRSWDDKDGNKRWSTEVITEEHYFAESKNSFENRSSYAENRQKAPAQNPAPSQTSKSAPSQTDGFYPIDESIEDDDLPF